ncbi:MAG: hypothetical protein GY947_01960 [Rhodobacteraceae bacterium]|nr:hypothetical protein [Paracoccaceae bacterium]
MTAHLLTRRPYREAPGLPLAGDLTLAAPRVHEFCGSARRTLALMTARNIDGPVFWILCHWQYEWLHADGVQRYMDPGRITFVTPKRLEDVLWCMEETLRAGCVPLVVAELPDPPPLTPVRRLHLAAESGAEHKKCKPLGLLLTPGDGGAAGVETRWHLSPRHEADQSRWMLQRRRARMAPPAAWALNWGKTGPELGAGV